MFDVEQGDGVLVASNPGLGSRLVFLRVNHCCDTTRKCCNNCFDMYKCSLVPRLFSRTASDGKLNCCTICGQQFKGIFVVNMHIVRTARPHPGASTVVMRIILEWP